MAALSAEAQHQLMILKRQYFQLETSLTYPDQKWLRQDHFQEALYNELYSESGSIHKPPHRYQLRILKELIPRIESSIVDWEEEAISDDLMSQLSILLSTPLTSEVISSQQHDYVTYTFSGLSSPDCMMPTVTLLESRNLLAAGGTTGLRTWEACLHLATYLCSCRLPPSLSITGKTVLELGAGTGLLSILCAKYLHAAHVIASDGSEAVITDLATNFYLNGLQNSPAISSKELKWGHALLGGEDASFLEDRNPDLVVGADVTYDRNGNAALIATLCDLVGLFPNVVILIAATIRNQDTWDHFLINCRHNELLVEMVDFPVLDSKEQEGPFYDANIPIQICKITQSRSEILEVMRRTSADDADN